MKKIISVWDAILDRVHSDSCEESGKSEGRTAIL